jgi:predicted Zn-dependent peptidase
MDVLGELIVRPTLDDHEIDHERTVIIEEIRSYLDDPAEYAQILFQLAMFGETPLGREICGDEDGIRHLPEATIHEFWGQTYRPSNLVIAVAGDLEHEAVLDLVRPAFGSGNGTKPAFEPAPDLPAGERILIGTRDTTQAHLSVGVPALPRDHADTWILTVLNTVLGEGMSCRLFQSVREEKALAYDVGSGVIDYADAGMLGVSAGVDPDELEPALQAILEELAHLRDELVPADELAKAKAYLSGGLELRMEETRHLASWVGGQEALHEHVYTLDEALEAVASVEASEIQRLAGELFIDERLRLAVVAPPRRGRGLERVLRIP